MQVAGGWIVAGRPGLDAPPEHFDYRFRELKHSEGEQSFDLLPRRSRVDECAGTSDEFFLLGRQVD